MRSPPNQNYMQSRRGAQLLVARVPLVRVPSSAAYRRSLASIHRSAAGMLRSTQHQDSRDNSSKTASERVVMSSLSWRHRPPRRCSLNKGTYDDTPCDGCHGSSSVELRLRVCTSGWDRGGAFAAWHDVSAWYRSGCACRADPHSSGRNATWSAWDKPSDDVDRRDDRYPPGVRRLWRFDSAVVNEPHRKFDDGDVVRHRHFRKFDHGDVVRHRHFNYSDFGVDHGV